MTAAAPSSKRIEANRRNAQKSTGPRTTEGKDRVRLNALKHGLTASTAVLPGEDAEGLAIARRGLEGRSRAAERHGGLPRGAGGARLLAARPRRPHHRRPADRPDAPSPHRPGHARGRRGGRPGRAASSGTPAARSACTPTTTPWAPRPGSPRPPRPTTRSTRPGSSTASRPRPSAADGCSTAGVTSGRSSRTGEVDGPRPAPRRPTARCPTDGCHRQRRRDVDLSRLPGDGSPGEHAFADLCSELEVGVERVQYMEHVAARGYSSQPETPEGGRLALLELVARSVTRLEALLRVHDERRIPRSAGPSGQPGLRRQRRRRTPSAIPARPRSHPAPDRQHHLQGP